MIRRSVLFALLALTADNMHAEYVNFEVSHVHPIGLTPSGSRLLVSMAFATDAGQPCAGCLLLKLTLSGSGNDTLLSWDEQPEAQSYCVERGDLGVLRATGGDFTLSIVQELASHTTETSLLFSGTPGPREGYWFLVKDNPAGTFDTGCPSQVDSRDDEIMGAGDICVN